MTLRRILPLVFALMFYALVMNVSAVKIIPKEESSYTCYDYSTVYHVENADTILLTMAKDPLFRYRRESHVVACRIIDNGTALWVHDGMLGQEYTLYDWYSIKDVYFHFWLEDGKEVRPSRTYFFMRDNREEILSQYDATELYEYHLEREKMIGSWHSANSTQQN